MGKPRPAAGSMDRSGNCHMDHLNIGKDSWGQSQDPLGGLIDEMSEHTNLANKDTAYSVQQPCIDMRHSDHYNGHLDCSNGQNDRRLICLKGHSDRHVIYSSEQSDHCFGCANRHRGPRLECSNGLRNCRLVCSNQQSERRLLCSGGPTDRRLVCFNTQRDNRVDYSNVDGDGRLDCSSELSDHPDIRDDCDVSDQQMIVPSGGSACSRFVALDCEFVGVGPQKLSALGRCTILDRLGKVLCDVYVRPRGVITDFRTRWSGIRKKDLRKAIQFKTAKRIIHRILKGKVIIGHALENDFGVLRLKHPPALTRDTSLYDPLREIADLPLKKQPSLKKLTRALLGRSIQEGEHCSLEDCRAALDLYRLVEHRWERDVKLGLTHDRNRCRRKHRNSSTRFLDDAYWPDDIQN